MQTGEVDNARRLAARLIETPPSRAEFDIRPTDEDWDGERPVALFSRFVDLEADNRLDLIAPDPANIPAATTALETGLELIAANDPALEGELRGIIREFLLVEQAPDHLFTTAAISCFQNWRGLVVNPAAMGRPLEMIELLAHEATHLTLFALALDEPLLTNPPEELYHSPIRGTPRSMDGVFHAAIVSARVTRALLRQSEAESLDPQFRALALERAAQTAQLVDEGVEIIEPNARLTSIGRQVLEDSKAYIESIRDRLPHPSMRDLAPAAAD